MCAAGCDKSKLQNEDSKVQQMKRNCAAGNNGGGRRTRNIKCYLSKSSWGAIVTVLLPLSVEGSLMTHSSPSYLWQSEKLSLEIILRSLESTAPPHMSQIHTWFSPAGLASIHSIWTPPTHKAENPFTEVAFFFIPQRAWSEDRKNRRACVALSACERRISVESRITLFYQWTSNVHVPCHKDIFDDLW